MEFRYQCYFEKGLFDNSHCHVLLIFNFFFFFSGEGVTKYIDGFDWLLKKKSFHYNALRLSTPTRLEDKNEIMRNNNISNIHKS